MFSFFNNYAVLDSSKYLFFNLAFWLMIWICLLSMVPEQTENADKKKANHLSRRNNVIFSCWKLQYTTKKVIFTGKIATCLILLNIMYALFRIVLIDPISPNQFPCKLRWTCPVYNAIYLSPERVTIYNDRVSSHLSSAPHAIFCVCSSGNFDLPLFPEHTGLQCCVCGVRFSLAVCRAANIYTLYVCARTHIKFPCKSLFSARPQRLIASSASIMRVCFGCNHKISHQQHASEQILASLAHVPENLGGWCRRERKLRKPLSSIAAT